MKIVKNDTGQILDPAIMSRITDVKKTDTSYKIVLSGTDIDVNQFAFFIY